MCSLIHSTKADTHVKTVGLSGPPHGSFPQLVTPYSFQSLSDPSTQARGPPESPVHVPRPPSIFPAHTMLSVSLLAYHEGWLHVERLNRVSSTSYNVRVACPPSKTVGRTVLLHCIIFYRLIIRRNVTVGDHVWSRLFPFNNKKIFVRIVDLRNLSVVIHVNKYFNLSPTIQCRQRHYVFGLSARLSVRPFVHPDRSCYKRYLMKILSSLDKTYTE